jgi:hypothetical protein
MPHAAHIGCIFIAQAHWQSAASQQLRFEIVLSRQPLPYYLLVSRKSLLNLHRSILETIRSSIEPMPVEGLGDDSSSVRLGEAKES